VVSTQWSHSLYKYFFDQSSYSLAISISDQEPDPGRPKLSFKKERKKLRNFMFEEPQRPLRGFKKIFMADFYGGF
jgi:hypothetical protein